DRCLHRQQQVASTVMQVVVEVAPVLESAVEPNFDFMLELELELVLMKEEFCSNCPQIGELQLIDGTEGTGANVCTGSKFPDDNELFAYY
ncbi:MAG: hypothetical protein EZS28_055519, partial [Streblomastix strix]